MHRLALRWGLSKSQDVKKVEADLKVRLHVVSRTHPHHKTSFGSACFYQCTYVYTHLLHTKQQALFPAESWAKVVSITLG